MKILVFEYITGGGFNKQELPDSLAKEGRLMLNALMDNLALINNLDVTIMLDWRFSGLESAAGTNIVIIDRDHDVTEEFTRLAGLCDLVWPIAPEFDGILHALCRAVESAGKILLASAATAVVIASDKFKTYELLDRHYISAVPTQMLEGDYFPGEVAFLSAHFSKKVAEQIPGEWIIKPVDGVGCCGSFVTSKPQDFDRMGARQGRHIIQPHLQGEKTSLSCLFSHGCGWLVCANLQRFEFTNNQYHLVEIVVNHHPDPGVYKQLIGKIALALPDLWGYAGIDLIETDGQIWVLEINPRLTTSFVGIFDALGINVAEAVLQLLHGPPALNPTRNRPVTIQVKKETHAS